MDYTETNELLYRAKYGPFNAAARASAAQKRVAFFDPRNSPSRMQFCQGYTQPYQVFAASNTWQTPTGQDSVARRAYQPSAKLPGLGSTTVPVLPPF